MTTPHHVVPPHRQASQDAVVPEAPPTVPGEHGDGVRAVAPHARSRLTQDQRDGRACVHCRAITGLKEAGHVVDGGLSYAVKVCRSCPPYAAILTDALGEEPRR
ncbi:hypothetical protein [Streptomyces sp. NRRL S-495]|uniref:hypothetical protein n=1 Tax=Streptomyces sp. NRRL S-495 TaxID=1609133 RepID=UPI0005F96412|nr:hypothetical protein [Streptomyces sp. NRRL S-495]KJY32590.1 hypothetical protein VR45_22100 [Streptomyces sp. NRRL S-495]